MDFGAFIAPISSFGRVDSIRNDQLTEDTVFFVKIIFSSSSIVPDRAGARCSIATRVCLSYSHSSFVNRDS